VAASMVKKGRKEVSAATCHVARSEMNMCRKPLHSTSLKTIESSPGPR
jgi:hypothetical protein